MPQRTEKLRKLRKRVSESGARKSPDLVGSDLAEAGVLDQAVLNRHIETILEGASGDPSITPAMAQHLDAFLAALDQGDVPGAAEHVTAVLSMEFDDLRRAALLSLMVRMAGKRRFDPVAAYVLEKRAPLETKQA